MVNEWKRAIKRADRIVGHNLLRTSLVASPSPSRAASVSARWLIR